MKSSILADLYGHVVDQSELEQVLSAHFGHASSSTPQQIEYRHADDGPPALTLSYDRDGELAGILPGPGLKSADVVELQEKIQRDLLNPTTPVIGRQILFAHVPTTGWFRYKSIFQIVLVPPEAPRPRFMMGDHPFMLEYQIAGSPDAMIRIQRGVRIAREIELLCVALVTPVKGSMGINSRHHWVIPEEADVGNLRSQFCQELYTWPGIPSQTADFSSVDEIPPLARVPLSDYYSRRGISIGQVLDLPDNFEVSLDSLFSLPRGDRDRFLRACFWFRHAAHAFAYSQSACFIALASAIEALVPDPVSIGTCTACGRSTGPGPTKLFIDFVEQYAPEPTISRSERGKLYKLRSALSHGGSLLHSDRETWSPALTPDRIRQWENMDGMWQVVRVALVNWLIAKSAGTSNTRA